MLKGRDMLRCFSLLSSVPFTTLLACWGIQSDQPRGINSTITVQWSLSSKEKRDTAPRQGTWTPLWPLLHRSGAITRFSLISSSLIINSLHWQFAFSLSSGTTTLIVSSLLLLPRQAIISRRDLLCSITSSCLHYAMHYYSVPQTVKSSWARMHRVPGSVGVGDIARSWDMHSEVHQICVHVT